MAFRPGWQFRDGKLMMFRDDGVLVLRGGTAPLAWEKRGARGRWRHVRPAIRLRELEEAARLTPERIDEIVAERRRDAAAPADPWVWTPPPFRDEEAVRAGLATRGEAARSFLATIAPEVRRVVRRFSSRQWHLLALCTRCPGALELAATNPGLAFAIASNWCFRDPAPRQPMRAARRLVRLRRRDAAAWLGFPRTNAAVRILGRVRPDVDVALLLSLRRSLAKPGVPRLLAHVPRIGHPVAYLVESDRLRAATPPALVREIARSPKRRQNVRLLRETYDDALLMGRRWPRPRSLAALRRFEARLDEEPSPRDAPIPQVPFPPAPYPAAAGVEPIRSAPELRAEGRRMRHCAGRYVASVAAGRCSFYRVRAPLEDATLALVRTRGGGWHLGQLRGRANARPRETTRDLVRVWSAAVGLAGAEDGEAAGPGPGREG